MYLWAVQLKIPLSLKRLPKKHLMKTVTRVEKILIIGLQIGIDGTTYMQRSRFVYSHVKNTSTETFAACSIPPGLLFCDRK